VAPVARPSRGTVFAAQNPPPGGGAGAGMALRPADRHLLRPRADPHDRRRPRGRRGGEPGGLLVYAPVAPTAECLSLLREIADVHGPVWHILLPSVAVEHKVNAGPYARNFPEAGFYVTDQQYSSVLPVGPNLCHPVAEMRQIFLERSSSLRYKITTSEPPLILTGEPEYTRALLFHARNSKDEIVVDTPGARRKGWRRIVLLFNFFFPGSGKGRCFYNPLFQSCTGPSRSNTRALYFLNYPQRHIHNFRHQYMHFER